MSLELADACNLSPDDRELPPASDVSRKGGGRTLGQRNPSDSPGGGRSAPGMALPAPAGAPPVAAGYVPKVEQAGAHDDFFEVGGNSILGAVPVDRLQVPA